MSAHSDDPAPLIWHFDGVSAVRHAPELIVRDAGFELRLPDRATDRNDWSALIALPPTLEGRVFGLKDRPGWRLGFASPIPEAVLPHLPRAKKYGVWIDKIGLIPAALLFAMLSGATGMILMKVPGWVAPHIPASWEKSLGTALVGDFGGRFCRSKQGSDALKALVRRVSPDNQDLEVEVANFDMVNAVTLPGGKIIILRGLLQTAETPDEVAGILAHEVGHVRHRDTVQALIRQMGLSVLLGGLSGNTGTTMNALIASTYSREAEAAADDFAINAMRTSRISPDGIASFFARLSEDEASHGGDPQSAGYLASHPASKSRQKAFSDSWSKSVKYTPVLTTAEWDALSDICFDDPNMRKAAEPE
jgi:beta-barrel assembly-enhancing protease